MSSPEPTAGDQPGNAILRIVWMFGPLPIGLIAFVLATEPAWQFSARDAVFWLAVAIVVSARVVDATRFGGATATGAPTSRADLTKYGVVMTVLPLLGWVAARAVEI